MTLLPLGDSIRPEDRKVRQFVRARGNISSSGGHQAHLSALAYMSDSYFIGTVSRVHAIPRFASPEDMKKVLASLKNSSDQSEETIARYLKEVSEEEAAELGSHQQSGSDRKTLSMMVSLDHTIYFHNPRAFRADEWIFTEMKSPWAGEGRGLVMQKMWSKDGVLIATCVQEVGFHPKSKDAENKEKADKLPIRELSALTKMKKGNHPLSRRPEQANCEDLPALGTGTSSSGHILFPCVGLRWCLSTSAQRTFLCVLFLFPFLRHSYCWRMVFGNGDILT